METAAAFLLDFFQSRPDADQVAQMAAEQVNNWPVFYHLTSQRHNLLDWYQFPSTANLLEIGAGCGALTGLFTSQVATVTALEPDPDRVAVLRARYQPLPTSQLQIIPQSLSEFTTSVSPGNYDLVTLIGVLEYAGQFYPPNSPENPLSPSLALLQDAAHHLRPGGQLILAIENRLGLKYWNGCAEDHLDQAFVSLENYLQPSSITTFSRTELSSLLHQAGFSQLTWYYPFPDYKLPQAVLHENLLTSSTLPLTLSELWADGWQPEKKLNPFTPAAVARGLQTENLWPKFAPSFLVFATL